MKLIINDYSNFRFGILDLFTNLMRYYDSADTSEEFAALKLSYKLFTDRVPQNVNVRVDFSRDETIDEFYKLFVSSPFRKLAMNSADAYLDLNIIRNAVRIENNMVFIKFYINNSYRPIEFMWTKTDGWDVTEEQFKRRSNPKLYVDFFTKLLSAITVEYNSCMDIYISGRFDSVML